MSYAEHLIHDKHLENSTFDSFTVIILFAVYVAANASCRNLLLADLYGGLVFSFSTLRGPQSTGT
jgi:hypothetical protein